MHDGGLASEHDRPAVVDLQTVTPAADGRLVEQDLARSRERLDPRGRGDGLAREGEVAGPVITGCGDHLAGRDPDPDLERLATVERLAQRGTDGQCREGGPDGVVVVGPGPAEHREHGIADELLARSLEAFDRVGHPTKRRADARTHLLGIELGDHPDVVDEVRKERCDDPPVTDLDGATGGRPFRGTGAGRGARADEIGPALVAVPGAGRGRCAARWTRHERAPRRIPGQPV